MSRLSKCPRCTEKSLELFSTHHYCANCNYGSSVDAFELAVPQWAFDVLKTAAEPKVKKKYLTEPERSIAV